MSLFDDTEIPESEIMAAADAIRALDQSEECERSKRETGYGASYIAMAIQALEAAARVRGRIVLDDHEGAVQ